MLWKAAMLSISLLALIACAPMEVTSNCTASSKDTVQIEVDVEVEGDKYSGYRLNILEDSMCAASAPKQRGCIEVPQDKRAEITFVLKDGKDPSCTGGGDGSWRWIGVRMSRQSTKSGAEPNPDAPSTGLMQDDFCTDRSGNVGNETFTGNRITIGNENSEAYDIWYTLIAESCGEKKTRIETDPWIRNKGTSS